MDFSKIEINKFDNKHMKIYTTSNQTYEKIKFDLENIKTPFGIEDYSNMKYINWEINNDLTELLEVVDDSFKNRMIEINSKYTSWSWISAIKKSSNYDTLLRTKLVDDLKVEKTYNNITIMIDSIWLEKKSKTFGILWITNKIN